MAGISNMMREVVKGRRTPFYCYDLGLLSDTLGCAKQAAAEYDYHIHYAVKANANERVAQHIFDKGFGADCVSGNEIELALRLGVSPEQIVFAGVGKADWELELAIENNIFCINVESLQELEVIQEIGARYNKVVRVALRVNPDVDARTHKNITTGRKENKFGIPMDLLPRAVEIIRNCENVQLTGIHYHIGSQIMELQPFIDLCESVNETYTWFIEQGMPLEHVNLGGGLGVNYNNPDIESIPNFKLFFRTISEHLNVEVPVHFELGRSLVAQFGTLVTQVLYTKEGASTNFLIVDAGMTELMRPALYDAKHKIQRLTPSDAAERPYSIVGPICESTDCFGEGVLLPETGRGDLLLIRSAGAYGEAMANNYNLRRLNEPVFLVEETVS